MFYLCYLHLFIYVYWYLTGFPCRIMLASFNSNLMGVTCGVGTLHPSGTPEFISEFIRLVYPMLPVSLDCLIGLPLQNGGIL